MATEQVRKEILDRAAVLNWRALPEQGESIRVPVVVGEDVWRTWAAFASHDDLMAASAALSHMEQQRNLELDEAERSRGPVYDADLEAEAAEQARQDHVERERKRPQRMEELLERAVSLLEAIAERRVP